MKSIKNFENKKITSSMKSIKGGGYRTEDCLTGHDWSKNNGVTKTRKFDFNPFNNDRK